VSEDSKESYLVESLKKVAQAFGASLGPWCEVVIHDLRKPESSIVEIVNSNVTGRKVGGPITDYGLRMLIEKPTQDLYIGYSTLSPDGRQLKSSTVLFRDQNGEPIIALCLNLDVTDFINFNKTCNSIIGAPNDVEDLEPIETFEADVVSTMKSTAERVISQVSSSTAYMKKADRVEVVRQLEDQGFFLLKGSVKFLAKKLGMSSFSIYKYLDEIKGK
jgi:predicted transcriptional regulator YheO